MITYYRFIDWNNKLNKTMYLSNLSKSNTNNSLAAIKARAKANAQRIANSK